MIIMLTIQIKNWQNEVIASVNNIFNLSIEDEVNKWWKLKLNFPSEERLRKKAIQKWYRISVSYWIRIWQVIKLFDWYITDIILKINNVEIQWENRLTYLQNRIIRNTKSYSDKTISYVIQDVFNEINTTKQLPISLWLNDCETLITKDFDIWTSFYDIIRYCYETEKWLVVRVIDWVLEVSKNTWNVLEWVWEYNAYNTNWTNIVDREWKDTMDNFFSYIKNENWDISNEEFNQDINLLFEKYENDIALSLPSWKAIPSVSVSRDTDWRTFNIGDRKSIRLNTWYDRLTIQYLWLIQSRKINITPSQWIKAEIKVSEEYKDETNILDLLLTNLRKK